MEFTRLAQITGENKYYDAIARITNALEQFQNRTNLPGLWPTNLDASGCRKVRARDISNDDDDRDLVDKEPANYDAKPDPNSTKKKKKKKKPSHVDADLKLTVNEADLPRNYDCAEQGLESSSMSSTDEFTLGAPSDSTYEYLPKEYLLLGGLNDQYRTMYENAMDTARDYMLFRPMLPKGRDVRFLASAESKYAPKDKSELKSYKYEGSHLSCYAGAMFGIGAKVFPGLEKDLDIAKKLTDGCVWAYESTATGIMPETFEVVPCESMESCEWNRTQYYDALDPFEEERKAALEFWEERKAALENDNNNNNDDDDENNKDEARGSKRQMKEEMEVVKQGLEIRDVPGPEHAPTKVKRDSTGDDDNDNDNNDNDDDDDDDELGPKPTLLSREEYAELRIKEERIPTGMTELSPKYLLRPEAIESVWVMHRLTGDDYWRRKGWRMFSAIAKKTRTDLANSAISDVTSEAPKFLGQMESFWLGETLKYFYLLFSEPHVVSLDDYIV